MVILRVVNNVETRACLSSSILSSLALRPLLRHHVELSGDFRICDLSDRLDDLLMQGQDRAFPALRHDHLGALFL